MMVVFNFHERFLFLSRQVLLVYKIDATTVSHFLINNSIKKWTTLKSESISQ